MAKKKETPEEILARLSSKYKGAICQPKDVASVPHTSLGFNRASSIWGLPRGRIVQIEGENHVGKSTFIMEAIAQYQRAGLRTVIMDYEHSFDRNYAKRIGIDMDALIFAQPDTLEDGYNMAIEMLEAEFADLLVVDSVSKMVPKAILEGDVGDSTVALEARLHSQGLKKIQPLLDKTGATMIGITQYRAKIGSMSPTADKGLTGGNSWQFDTSMRIKLSRLKTDKDNGFFINNVEITKNKTGTPFLKYKMYYTSDAGIDVVRETIEYGKELGLITQGGSHYHYGETKLSSGHGGMDTVKQFAEDNPEFFMEIRKKVEDALKEADN